MTAIRDVPIVFNLSLEEREMLPVMGVGEGALVAEAHRGQKAIGTYVKMQRFWPRGRETSVKMQTFCKIGC